MKAAPLQVYIEDTYLTKVKEHLTDLIPTLLIKGEGYVQRRAPFSPCKSTASSKATDGQLDKREEGGGASAAKGEGKAEEEDTDLFNVSDEEMESPLSYSPWKKSEDLKKPHRERDADEEERCCE